MINSYKAFDFRIRPRFFDLDDAERSKIIIDNLFEGIRLGAPKQSLSVTCDDERELMLCEEVIRRCNNEPSEWSYAGTNDWEPSSKHVVVKGSVIYRAKPKKELVVPWEFLPDSISEVTVSHHKDIALLSNGIFIGHAMLKLDLTDVELPVTVKRPE